MNASSPRFLLFEKVASGKFIPVANGRALRLLLSVTLLLISAHRLPAPIFETPEKLPSTPGTSVNADGSRTLYEIDSAHHTALATITERSGKLREKIRYELDGAGRFTTRRIFDPDGKLRSKSVYKYDKAGRLLEETLVGKDDAVLHRITYSYDQSGKQTGHSVFDGNGKLLDQTSAVSPSRSPPQRAFEGGVPGS